MATSNVQVLVVGGGIVGLSASLILSHHSIPHILIERHASTSIHPRARGLNTRAMEIFRSLGIDEAVAEAGASLSPSAGFVRGSSFREVMEPRPRKEDAKRGLMPGAELLDGLVSPVKGVRCTQDMMEPVLLRIARERGGELRYSTELESFEQDSEGVTATLLDRENGTTSTVHAEYLIAADGAGSPIRKKLGISTTGKGALGNLINILFHADLRDLVRGREISICTIIRPGLRGILTSINNDNIWVFHLSDDPSKAEDYTRERCLSLLQSALGIPDLKIDIKSMYPWQPSEITASKMQSNRIFLAGDSAHQTTPYAGQGATTGISDVWDLCWKLSYVLSTGAPPALLQTYEEERLPVAQFVSRESGLMADEYGLPDTNKGKLHFIWNFLCRVSMITGFGYAYTSSTIIPEESTPSPKWNWLWSFPWSLPSLILGLRGAPGTRAPHVWVQYNGTRISTLDLFGKSFVLLAGSEGKGWCDAAEKLGGGLVAYRVGPTGDLSDPQRAWESAAGISSRGALLVRPDGFVAWRVGEQEGDLGERLGEVMRRVLCR